MREPLSPDQRSYSTPVITELKRGKKENVTHSPQEFPLPQNNSQKEDLSSPKESGEISINSERGESGVGKDSERDQNVIIVRKRNPHHHRHKNRQRAIKDRTPFTASVPAKEEKKTEQPKRNCRRANTVMNQPREKRKRKKKDVMKEPVLEPQELFKLTFADLPEDIQKKCKLVNLEQDLMNAHIKELFTISKFLFKSSFPETAKPSVSARKKGYVNDEMLSQGKSEIKKPLKPPQKTYKKPENWGTGGFGSVMTAKDMSVKKGRRVAIKVLPHTTEREMQTNYSEVFFLSRLKHPNIVDYYETLLVEEKNTPPSLWIVMQFIEGGTLSDASTSTRFSDKHVAYTAREMLKGISYLHQNLFVHRDLKSSNIMLSINGEVKIIDFGLCTYLPGEPVKKLLGSPFWIPPEMIKGKPHSFPVDIWSFGVCVLEMFLGSPPHNISPIKCMFNVCTKGLTDLIPPQTSPPAREFLEHCLAMDPTKRPTADQLLTHPWLTQPQLEQGYSDILKRIWHFSLKSL
uniref:Protein kinase domain-containing protein n=1 Tax=Arcella intermedia TaxID=1963864 RepID=A0A6B2L233_9EUKA